MTSMNKILLRVYGISGIVIGISGIGFLVIAFYTKQSFAKELALIGAVCSLLACSILISVSLIGSRRFHNKNNVN